MSENGTLFIDTSNVFQYTSLQLELPCLGKIDASTKAWLYPPDPNIWDHYISMFPLSFNVLTKDDELDMDFLHNLFDGSSLFGPRYATFSVGLSDTGLISNECDIKVNVDTRQGMIDYLTEIFGTNDPRLIYLKYRSSIMIDYDQPIYTKEIMEHGIHTEWVKTISAQMFKLSDGRYSMRYRDKMYQFLIHSKHKFFHNEYTKVSNYLEGLQYIVRFPCFFALADR